MKLSHASVKTLIVDQKTLTDQELLVHNLRHSLNQAQAELGRLRIQSKTLHTLTSGIFNFLPAPEIYDLVCETLVTELGWDTSFFLVFHGGRPQVASSYQATQKQLAHLEDFLEKSAELREAYSRKMALSTFKSGEDPAGLVLRALFNTDEVIAMPAYSSEHFFGYVVACSHTHHTAAVRREDIEFLAILAAHVAQSLKNSQDFNSLMQQNDKLRQLDELKDSFISITSHQLRTPLSIIKWTLSILEGDPAIIALPEQLKMISQAYESNERLIHVVNDLLNISRIDDGHLPYNPQPTNIVEMLQDLSQGLQKTAQSRNIRVRTFLPDLMPTMQLDSILLKEGLQNLIDNALDYNQKEGWVELRAWIENDTFKISISNTGFGISQDDQAHIFDQFYRSGLAVKYHPNGNGLGLFLTRAIVKEHGGEISCQSGLDQITIFTITLPLSPE